MSFLRWHTQYKICLDILVMTLTKCCN